MNMFVIFFIAHLNYFFFSSSERNITTQCQESVQCQDTLHCIRGICQCDVTEYWTHTACAKSSVFLQTCF